MAVREKIYYWKSDRPHTSGNLQRNNQTDTATLEAQLAGYLSGALGISDFIFKPANGQGNHITYTAKHNGDVYFVRLENGPEKDDYMDVESAILDRLKAIGVPCPAVYLSDSSRQQVPFAIQVMEYLSYPNLNVLKPVEADLSRMAEYIGKNIALWQKIPTENFGLFDPGKLSSSGVLSGYHDTYEKYFFLNFDQHLDYLAAAGFLEAGTIQLIKKVCDAHRHLLDIPHGCLVHKDVAFWNILSDGQSIKAFIDWDDAIAGDPVDDLSLLGCFHSGKVIAAAIHGYRENCGIFPQHFEQRFWLHLLRNMIFKSVIRVRGKYFEIKDEFFLLDTPGKDLRTFTIDRINSACKGLMGKQEITDL